MYVYKWPNGFTITLIMSNEFDFYSINININIINQIEITTQKYQFAIKNLMIISSQ